MADWQLTQPSEVSFVSFKNTHLAENHRFEHLQGSVSSSGEALVRIDLSSIDSGIPVRDGRMRELLFQVGDFSHAEIRAAIPAAVLNTDTPQPYELQGQLALHGNQESFRTTVMVTPAADGTTTVNSLTPVLVHADSFALSRGIRELRDIAKLDSIAEVVPVSFSLTFKPAN
ncbi:hypothetical protein GCM10011297_03920 [Bacterioplanes sanyensis]|nr:hypothetical protein GCM10011297_03920 [Bacterioplanes sanyensis]